MLRARAGQGPGSWADCRSGAYLHRHSPKVRAVRAGSVPRSDRGDLPERRRDPESLAVTLLQVAQPGYVLAQSELRGAVERAVGMIRPELHRTIDVGRLRDPFASRVVGLVDDRQLDARNYLIG